MMNFKNTHLTLDQIIPILNVITDAVFIDDADGVCQWCNDACEEMYNIEYDEIVGRHVEDLEKSGIFTPSVTRRVLEEKREITIIHENRFGRRLLTTGSPVFVPMTSGEWVAAGEGRYSRTIAFVLTTSRDITQISTVQEQPDTPGSALLKAGNLDVPEDVGSSFIVSESEAMHNVMALTKKLASVNTTVLITGESGVGKGLIARRLHEEGVRWKKPFVTVNCGAIPENLIESELFGYVAGAFTGSRADGKQGLFEAAQDGTIFLDEISELPLNLQVKLLQVIQERQITPVGGTRPIPVDVRIISATNRNLEELVKAGRFREDLYYRLNVVPINVPSLRERPADIIPLIQMNIARCNRELGETKSISPDALSILLKYPWPGNIRELQNIIERLVITTSHNVITEDDIFIFIKEAAEDNQINYADTSLAAALERAEKEILSRALENYKSTRAIARVLKVSQPTIVRKLNKYGLVK
ncbi:MAG: sigma 54-interacting transcriptional regulator [Clostridiales bacterium]|nr:sigma 54-interacting transcriptional regulator [Clostridiales bacterium]